MVNALIDTTVLIDALRDYPLAEKWLETQTSLGISQAVVLELLQGVSNKQGQKRALDLLEQYTIVEVASTDFEWAITQLKRYRLSHSVGGTDALIAAVAFRLQVPLYTRNLKHFAPMLGELAQQPY